MRNKNNMSRSGLFSHRILTVFAAALPLQFCSATPAQDIRIPYEKFILPNGLPVLVHEDHKAPIVAVELWYNVGSKDEKPGKTGFAHLFEHLMFGGSEDFHGRYLVAMENVGATGTNGTTNPDRTNYYEVVPDSALDYTLFLESDRMGHFYSTINQQTLDLQRGVVQNEKREGDNQPYSITDYLIAENTHPQGHPYSWTTIGSMDDLNAASLSDVQQWFRTYYGPSNALLVLAGDIDVATAREKALRYFGDIPPGPPVAHQSAWVAKMSGVHRQRVQDRVPLARLYDVWNVPEYGDADADYLDLVSDLLASGKDSRLYKRLVYDSQLATSVEADMDVQEIGSQFSIVATAKPGGDLTPITRTVQQELERFLRDGPTAEEVERVKTAYEADVIRGMDRVQGKADLLAQGQLFVGNPEQYRVSLERVRNATPEQLRDAARRWLSDGLYQLEVTPYPDMTTVPSTVNRAKLPEVGPTPEAKLPEFERATLANGLRIVLAERHELPMVNFSLVFEGGYAADHFSRAGVARMTSTLMTAGTDKYTTLQISDQLQRLGAELSAGADLNTSDLSLSALKSKLEPSLTLYADILMHPSFPDTEFERQQKLALAGIAEEKSQPGALSWRLFAPLLYGQGHPYGIPMSGSGTEASVRAMTRDDVLRFHDTWFRPNNATLTIVGDTTIAEIRPELERLFADWKPGPLPQQNVPRATGPQQVDVYLIDKPDAVQSRLMAGTFAPSANDPQRIPLHLWNDVFSGTFSGRLNMNLREDKHWSYGTHSYFIDAAGQGAWITSASVETDKTKESLVEMNSELHQIVTSRPITEKELDAAKADETRSLAGSREGMEQVEEAMDNVVEYSLPEDYFATFGDKVQKLSADQVNVAGTAMLHPDQMIWIIVGDRSKIEPGIRELNLGTLHVIDADGRPVP